MITYSELEERKELSNDEIRWLMDFFGVPEMDLVEECGVTHPTFQIYLGENTTDMPKKHQKTIIALFLRLFDQDDGKIVEDLELSGYADKEDKKDYKRIDQPETFEATNEGLEEPEEEAGSENSSSTGGNNDAETYTDGEEAPREDLICEGCGAHPCQCEKQTGPGSYPYVSDGFKALEVDKLIFRPKNGIEDALAEAYDIAFDVKAPVYLRYQNQIITISVNPETQKKA